MTKLSLLLLSAASLWAAPPSFHVLGGDAAPWKRILGSVGFTNVSAVPNSETAADWAARIEEGAYLILEGDSPLARSFGFRPTAKRARAANVQDLHRPSLSIIWEAPVELPVFELAAGVSVFVREKWQGAPLVAGIRRGAGGVLWLAVSPGERGYERFPCLVQALADLGLSPPFRSRRLWAFFDSSYRLRADTDYLTRRWRRAGIAALHVAAWHYFESDPARDEYLRTLIESCHRRGILVYAWLELPHVSERFWNEHPEWREKTALLQDAHLDWRKLMNLANGFCFRVVARGVRGLVERFDWDGVNLAELYFESLEGHANPSRFTPMNDDVRRGFQEGNGFDPAELFDPGSPRHYSKAPAALRAFLDYRAELSHRIQVQWIAEANALRSRNPDLDVVLTHVDDRFDTRMRDALGADAGRMLPLADRYRFTFLVEDPATVWNLGPERYTQIAAKYRELTAQPENLAIDINIAERYQDVYPTRQQTGAELFQLVNTAARAFPRVALYFEHSILAPDVEWLSSAAAAVERFEPDGSRVVAESRNGVGIRWDGPALVDGRPWPALDGATLWLPAGNHVIESARAALAVRLVDFSGDLTAADALPSGVEFAYRSSARALASFDRRPRRIEVDGSPLDSRVIALEERYTVFLPRGQHVVTVEAE